ncbi:hypothetical protein DAEQUDRAFT_51280 [Daedalea quercina L-15889]|uniref:Uncharacterized protein n=1 Tax=Daedalea quercina L-15889 TaxID=1314783 RepID=A0A165LA87_9APHY|nr:hypothetical protein DAEQUDRAFT_51280 [Daedalea quercina L-15889]
MESSSTLSFTLANAVVESVLYGIALLLITTSLWLLWDQHRIRPGKPARRPSFAKGIPLMIAGSCLLLGTTAHWIVTVIRLFRVLVTHNGDSPLADYLNSDLDKPLAVASIAILVFCLFISNALWVYRLWIIWAFRGSIVILPICALAAYMVSGIGTAYETAHFSNATGTPEKALWRWAVAAIASNFCLNVYCTGAVDNSSTVYAWLIPVMAALIAGKLLVAKYKVIKVGLRTGILQILEELLPIILVSASIYTAWSTFYFVSYAVNSRVYIIAGNSSPAVAGIMFGLIIIRSRLTWPQAAAGSGSTEDDLRFASPHTQAHLFASITVNVAEAMREFDNLDVDLHNTPARTPMVKPEHLYGHGLGDL